MIILGRSRPRSSIMFDVRTTSRSKTHNDCGITTTDKNMINRGEKPEEKNEGKNDEKNNEKTMRKTMKKTMRKTRRKAVGVMTKYVIRKPSCRHLL